MTFKTGSWGEQAKHRSKRRKEYFKKYREIHGQNNYKGIGTLLPKEIRDAFLLEKDLFCQVCKVEKKEGSKTNLLVHHKDKNCTNNEFENLIILCRGCHNKVHIRNPLGRRC